jgi:hypothetical protein
MTVRTMYAYALADTVTKNSLGQRRALSDPALSEVALAVCDDLPDVHLALIIAHSDDRADPNNEAGYRCHIPVPPVLPTGCARMGAINHCVLETERHETG